MAEKAARYKKLLPKLKMQKKMYDNILMRSPEGTLLCTISEKKKSWYLNKGLAMSDADGGITLLFTPRDKNPPPSSAPLHAAELSPPDLLFERRVKRNSCVVCAGSDDGYMRHYIVPSCVRRLLPKRFKSHLSHDVVLVCPGCFLSVQSETGRRLTSMEREAAGGRGGKKVVVDEAKMKARSAAAALVKYGGRMPEEVVKRHRGTVEAFLGREATAADLERLKDIDYTRSNPSYVPPSQLLVDALKTEVEIAAFVRGWRRFFVDMFRPKNMPEGWRVEARVTNDGCVMGSFVGADAGDGHDACGSEGRERPALHPLVESILTSPGTVPHPSGLTLEGLAASPVGDELDRPPEVGRGDGEEIAEVKNSFGDVGSGGYESPPRSKSVIQEEQIL